MTLSEYKKLFFKSDRLHLNNAGLSPIMKPAQEEINYWANRFYEDGYYSDHDYMARVDWTRQQIAKLVDCDKEEIAFFPSCAGGISQFAFGINLKAAEEVILFDQEYSSNLYPWQQACKKAGAKLIVVDSDVKASVQVDDLIAVITSKTKVIAISYVQFQTGIVMDLEKLSKICQQKGILLFVDAMQAIGLHPISFKNLKLDGLVCGSHKWLNAAVGVAFLIVKKDLVLRLDPIAIGSGTYGTCDDPSDFACEPKRDASRFEPGAKQVLEICSMGRSIEVVQQVGIEVLRIETYRLSAILKEQIKKLGFEVHENFDNKPTQFINFSSGPQAKALQKYLFDHGVHLPLRGPGVRATPHALNSEDDLNKFVKILAGFTSEAEKK